MRLKWQVPLLLLLAAAGCGQGGGPGSEPVGPQPPAPPGQPPDDPDPPDPAPTPEPSAACAGYEYSRLVPVAGSSDLRIALAGARPGDLIQLADGRYTGGWTLTISGTPEAPIVLCGAAGAILDGGLITNRDVIMLRSSYWILGGFTITGGLRGVYSERATHNILENLTIHTIGQEAVHWRVFSSHNVVRDSRISHTGRVIAEFGEGIYIGQFRGHWATSTGGAPDRSDSNAVIGNVIGPHVTAELVDAKEGTTGGVITGNTFDGIGMARSQPWVDSWVEINGNDYLITDNTGTSSPQDGFQVMVGLQGWGNGNVFERNAATVAAGGFGFHIGPGASGNVVACNNLVESAGAGFANIPCQ